MAAAASRGCYCILSGEVTSVSFMFLPCTDSWPLQRRKKTGDGASCRYRVSASPCFWSGTSVGSAVALYSCLWLGSEPVAPGTGGCSVCLSCHMDGSKERGVFVLSRELYSFLSIFINNSAHGQGGWGRGDRSREGQQQHWRSGQVEARGELTSPASQLWPSNRARWPQGPCLEECRPGICS